MDFVPLLVMSALVKKLVDFVKYITSNDWNAVVTQVVAWAAGIILAFIGSNSDWAQNVVINGLPLSDLNNWSLAFVGVNVASLAGFGWDTLKAIDGSNSAAVPNLIHPERTVHDT